MNEERLRYKEGEEREREMWRERREMGNPGEKENRKQEGKYEFGGGARGQEREDTSCIKERSKGQRSDINEETEGNKRKQTRGEENK